MESWDSVIRNREHGAAPGRRRRWFLGLEPVFEGGRHGERAQAWCPQCHQSTAIGSFGSTGTPSQAMSQCASPVDITGQWTEQRSCLSAAERLLGQVDIPLERSTFLSVMRPSRRAARSAGGSVARVAHGGRSDPHEERSRDDIRRRRRGARSRRRCVPGRLRRRRPASEP